MDSDPGVTSWHIVSRWQEFEGESRANLLRIVAIFLFYLVELGNYYGLDFGPIQIAKVEGVDLDFHRAMTATAVGWTMVSLGALVCLRKRFFPASLKYVTTGCDLLFLTLALLIADGPRSPLTDGFFLLIALAALRFSLPLVRFATVGSVAAYLVLIGNAYYFRTELKVPRYHEFLFLISVIVLGVLCGQIVRRMRHAAEDFTERERLLREDES